MNNQRLKSKHSAEMTIGTIVIIILALVVLVFLVFAFAKGTGGLNDYITNLFAGSSNIDTIKNSCNAVCASNAQAAFCSEVRTVRTTDKKSLKGSCATLAGLNPSLGIEGCSAITCTDAALTTCESLEGQWNLASNCQDTETEVDASKIENTQGHDIKKESCCILKQTPKTCASLGGKWGVTACVSGKTDLTAQVTNNEGKGTNTICCQI